MIFLWHQSKLLNFPLYFKLHLKFFDIIGFLAKNIDCTKTMCMYKVCSQMMMKGSSPTKICIRTILLNFLTKLRTNKDFSRLIFKLDWFRVSGLTYHQKHIICFCLPLNLVLI